MAHSAKDKALYLRWRPQTFDDVIGQEHITRSLRYALAHQRRRHAYLFSGIRGTGKTTMARLLAKAVNCLEPEASQRPCDRCKHCIAIKSDRFLDLIEIDAASQSRVENVRELLEKVAFAPGEGAFKVYIIDEVHRFSASAFDALLKTLEDPPGHVVFVLATTEIDKVPLTIKSRCVHYQLRRVPLRQVVARLEIISASEGLQVEAGVLELVARQGEGSVRDSISLLDQLITAPDETIALADARQLLGTASSQFALELAGALADEDGGQCLRIIHDAIQEGSAAKQLTQQFLDTLRHIMLAQTAGTALIEATAEERAAYDDLAQRMNRARLLKALRACSDAAASYTTGWQPQLTLELVLLEALHAEQPPAPAPVQHTVPVPAQRPQSRRARAAQSARQAPDADYTRPPVSQAGEAAAYAVGKIRQSWTEILTQVNRYNRNIPPLLEHAHVRVIEGNRLILGVSTPFFQQKIIAPERARIIEQAIHDLHQVKLRIEVQVVNGAPEPAAPARAGSDEDPLLATGIELGGVIKRD